MKSLLSHMQIGHRLLLTLPVLAVIVGFFGVQDIYRIRTDMLARDEASLRTVVEAAVSTLKFYDDQANAGRITHAQAVAAAKDALHAFAFNGTEGFIFVHDFAGYTQINRQRNLEGKYRLDSKDAASVANIRNQIALARAGGGVAFYRLPAEFARANARRMSVIRPFMPWQWAVGAGVFVDDVDQVFWQAAGRQAGIAACVLLLAAGAILWVARTVSRPMGRITASMAALAGGNVNVAIPFIGRRNEFGALAAALQVFRDNAHAVQQLRDAQRAAEAQAETERRAGLLRVADDFESAIAGVLVVVGSAAGDMQQAAETLSASASQSANQAEAASGAAETASAGVNNAATGTGQLAASIAEIAGQVATATTIAREAVAEAHAARDEINRLTAAADEIGGVIDLIRTIAGQTNLLALNATIEAARAGEAGRGFAVVAAEVKTLAGEVARATGEIQSKVASMQHATGRSAEGIASIAGIIGRVSEAATAIAAAVEQQDAATRNIAENVKQAAAGTSAVSANMAGLGTAVAATADAAAGVHSAAGLVATNTQDMRARVSAFLGSLRAA